MTYETQSPDTSRETEEILFAAYRRMSAAEKLERVGRLGAMVKSVVLKVRGDELDMEYLGHAAVVLGAGDG